MTDNRTYMVNNTPREGGDEALQEPQRWQPVASEERLKALDALRGMALFGVLLVNLQSDFRVPLAQDLLKPQPGDGFADAAVDLLLRSLLEFKAFAVFSLLFGAGIAIVWERTAARSIRGGVFLVRRLLILLGIGLIHLLLIWNGDILTLYAVCGLLLIPFLRLPPFALLVVGIAGIGCQVYGVIDAVFPSEATLKVLAMGASIYPSGSFVAMLTLHLRETRLMIVPLLVGSLPKTWGLMALGVAAWRAGLISQPDRHRRFLVSLTLIAGAVAVPPTAFAAFAAATGQKAPLPEKLVDFAYLPLALAYASGGFLLLSTWRWLTQPFAAAGQMALSNYLGSSVVFSLLFYGFGLGLCGRLGTAPATAIGVAVYVAQLGLSRWWLRRYRFGPVEWLWRSLTYGTLQPLRV